MILRAIADSALALTYVIILLFLFFFHFAIAGVFLFAQNDPYYFGNIGKSFITLFQVSTLDAWIGFARTNMYGCDLYGYQTGEDYFDVKCENPLGLGWLAAFYFFCFIVFGTMVLLSLFIGILIASMEIIKQSMKDENAIWKKVSDVQAHREYINSTTVANLLEVFDLIDVGANGILTLIELKPLLEIVSKVEATQYNIFLKVDKDYSGCVDFAEFLEFIHHLGVEYRHMKAEEAKKTPPILKNDEKERRKRFSDSTANWSFKNLNTLMTASSSPKVGSTVQEEEGGKVESNSGSGGGGGNGGLLQRLSSSLQRSFSMSNDAKSNSPRSKSRSCDRDSEAESGSRKGSNSSVFNVVSNVSGRSSKVSCAVDLPVVKSKRANTGTWPTAAPSIKEEDNIKTDKTVKPKERSSRRIVNSQLSFPRDVHYSDDDDAQSSPLGKSSPIVTSSIKPDNVLDSMIPEASSGRTSVMNQTVSAQYSGPSSGSGCGSRSGHVVSSSGEIEIVDSPPGQNHMEENGNVDGLRQSRTPSPAHMATEPTCSSSTSPRSTRFIHTKSNEDAIHALLGTVDGGGDELTLNDQSATQIQNHVKNYKRKSKHFVCNVQEHEDFEDMENE